MVEWLYEDGIGEARAALVARDTIVEALVVRVDGGIRLGAVVDARLERKMAETGRAALLLPDGARAILNTVPPRISDGATLRVAITREAIPDAGDPKPAQARLAAEDEPLGPGPTLMETIRATGLPVATLLPHQPDRLEAAGWGEVLEEARTGLVTFADGLLRISPTPAMTLIDVDGAIRNARLASEGAAAAARAIRRLGITGSIGLDLPTLAGKGERQAAAAEVDRVLPQPFERTAVNGFGFLQIVRRRTRPSLIETLRADPVAAAAIALLRRAERAGGTGPRSLVAAPAVIRLIAAHPDWTDALARRIGAAVALREDAALAISAGDVVSRHA